MIFQIITGGKQGIIIKAPKNGLTSLAFLLYKNVAQKLYKLLYNSYNIMDWFRRKTLVSKEKSDVFSGGSDSREKIYEEWITGEYDVPKSLKDDGFYLIQYSLPIINESMKQSWVSMSFLYDRKERLAIMISSLDLYAVSFKSTAESIFQSIRDNEYVEGVEFIEEYLTGKLKPKYLIKNEGFLEGVKSFNAKELENIVLLPMRQRMLDIKKSRLALDEAANAFIKEAISLRGAFLPASENLKISDS